MKKILFYFVAVIILFMLWYSKIGQQRFSEQESARSLVDHESFSLESLSTKISFYKDNLAHHKTSLYSECFKESEFKIALYPELNEANNKRQGSFFESLVLGCLDEKETGEKMDLAKFKVYLLIFDDNTSRCPEDQVVLGRRFVYWENISKKDRKRLLDDIFLVALSDACPDLDGRAVKIEDWG